MNACEMNMKKKHQFQRLHCNRNAGHCGPKEQQSVSVGSSGANSISRAKINKISGHIVSEVSVIGYTFVTCQYSV